MQVKVNQKNLGAALNIVSKAVNNNNTLPILNNLLLVAKDQTLTLSATNLEIAIVEPIQAEIIQEGSITVPAKLLQSYVSLLKNEDLSLTLNDNKLLSIESSKSSTTINTIEALDYPNIPKIESDISLSLQAAEFLKALNYTSFACSINTTQPVLAGVFLEISKENLTFAATDSYRLSEYKIPQAIAIEENLQVIIPQRALQELSRIITSINPNDITIYLSKNQVSFQIENVTLISRLIDGKYPEYSKILPKAPNTEAKIDKEELNTALKRVNLFAKEANNSIHINLDQAKQTLIIKSDQTRVGQELSEIPVAVSGSDNQISINSQYLTDLLAVLNVLEINMGVNEKTTPVKITEPDNSNFLYIIMPLRV